MQEIWTLCRIFQRNLSNRKLKSFTPDWREVSAKCKPPNSRPKSGNLDSENQESYICFGAQEVLDNEKKPFVGDNNMNERKQLNMVSDPESCSNTVLSDEAMEFFAYGNWDEIVSAMDNAFDPNHF